MAGLVAALALGWAGPVLAQGTRSAPKPLAVVYGVEISEAEVDAIIKMTGPTTVHLSPSQQHMRKLEALSLLIDNALMRRFLASSTPTVDPAEMGRRLSELAAGLKAQGKSIAEHCRDTNQTEEQLRASIADYIRWASYVRQKISEADLANYYRENKDFFDQVTVRASHIVLRLPPRPAPKELADATARLKQIRAELVSNPRADFGEYARRYSQDARAKQGGDLGAPFPRKWAFDESFSRAAFSLKVGEVSDVVQTDFGLHLIKVTERNPGKPSDFGKIKEAVREFCAEDLRQAILAHEREEARKADKVKVYMP
jgi:peptidyl-prolyl cis-trans isomerase C